MLSFGVQATSADSLIAELSRPTLPNHRWSVLSDAGPGTKINRVALGENGGALEFFTFGRRVPFAQIPLDGQTMIVREDGGFRISRLSLPGIEEYQIRRFWDS